MPSRPRSAMLLALFVVSALPLSALAETVNCTAITSAPAIITQPGIYCLTGSLATNLASGNAIDIQANNVVLDLNGFRIANLAAGPGTTASGISAFNRQNITIKNGIVRGFVVGININDSGASQGHVIEDIRADQNTYIGIRVNGAGVLIRHNLVVATGGTTGGLLNGNGIYVTGTGPRVIDNDVINTVKQPGGIAWGIQVADSPGALVVNNRISTADRGIEYVGGSSSGKYRDNMTTGVSIPYTGGTDAGNNN